MPTSPSGFASRIDRLKNDLIAQGRRVATLLEGAFEAVFERSTERARTVIGDDDAVDRVDVEIEKSAVALLTDATHENARLDARQLRTVLTIVKVNNELERIADAAVAIAERIESLDGGSKIPATFRVMANSVLGIIRDTVTSLDRQDAALAKVVLQSQDTVIDFKQEILRDAEMKIAAGRMTVDFGFALHELAQQCEIMADHCTNIAEQVIYSATGAIVRHLEGKWEELPAPP
jgi:phosphate transport system protein